MEVGILARLSDRPFEIDVFVVGHVLHEPLVGIPGKFLDDGLLTFGLFLFDRIELGSPSLSFELLSSPAST